MTRQRMKSFVQQISAQILNFHHERCVKGVDVVEILRGPDGVGRKLRAPLRSALMPIGTAITKAFPPDDEFE